MAELYVANVRLRWRNRITGVDTDAQPGAILQFEAGDFDEPGARPSGAIRGLADALARGVIRPFVPDEAGDPDHMSRDEMLHWLRAQGVQQPGGNELAHNEDPEVLRAMVRSQLAVLAAPAAEPRPARRQRPAAAEEA